MRRIRRALLPLLTALLIAAGAAMPYAACRLQDNQLDGAEERSLDSVSLTLRQKGGIGETARLMADRYSMVEWSGETAMTEEEALEVGVKALEEMSRAEKRRLNQYHRMVYETISPYLTEEEGQWLKEYTREI